MFVPSTRTAETRTRFANPMRVASLVSVASTIPPAESGQLTIQYPGEPYTNAMR